MAKKLKLEKIKVTDEILGDVGELGASVFKEILRQGKKMEGDAIFQIFVEQSLRDSGIPIEDAYEQLSFNDFTKVMSKVMEINNMDELFRAIERLSRTVPTS